MPIGTTEQRKSGKKILEDIISEITEIQYKLKSNKSRDNEELLNKIGEQKHDLNTEFNDSFGLKITEQIIAGHEELMNKIGILKN